MKVTRKLVKWFEKEQRTYGTEVALANAYWLQADAQLRELGAKAVKVKYRKGK